MLIFYLSSQQNTWYQKRREKKEEKEFIVQIVVQEDNVEELHSVRVVQKDFFSRKTLKNTRFREL